ncbi:MAG: tetratricopeptide repeat protein, partial [Candidatus Hodarchaeales archaeon]
MRILRKKSALESKFQRASRSLTQGEFQKTTSLLQQILREALHSSLWDLAGKALAKLGRTYFLQGGYEDAKSAYAWAEHFAKRASDQRTLNISLNGLGLVNLKMGDPEMAQEYLEHALSLGKNIKDPNRITASLNNLGLVHRHLGNLTAAIKHYEEARDYLQSTSQTKVLLAVLINLAIIYGIQGELDQSDQLYDECLVMAENDPERVGILKLNRSYNEFARDTPKSAARLLQEGLERIAQHGIGGTLRTNLYLGLAQAYIELKKPDEAMEILKGIEAEIDQTHPMGRAELLYLYGRLSSSVSQRKMATKYFQNALSKAQELPDLSIELSSLVRLAEIALREFESSSDETEMKQAIARVDQALQLAARERVYPIFIEVTTLRALLSASLCLFDRAQSELRAALKLAEDRELSNSVKKIEENMNFVKTQQQVLAAYGSVDSDAEIQVRDLSFQQFRSYLKDVEAIARTLPES